LEDSFQFNGLLDAARGPLKVRAAATFSSPQPKRRKGTSASFQELSAQPRISISVGEGYLMRAAAPRLTLEVEEPVALGDVPLAPPELTGMSQAELARSMAESLLRSPRGSDARPLSALRHTFPHAPLTARLAALAGLVRR
jgi:hypothetical protein